MTSWHRPLVVRRWGSLIWRIIVSSVWETRLQLLSLASICWLLSFGQGRDLALSLQVRHDISTIVGLSAALAFAWCLAFWTYIAIKCSSIYQAAKGGTESVNRRIKWLQPTTVGSTYGLISLAFVAWVLFKNGERTAALALALANLVIGAYAAYCFLQKTLIGREEDDGPFSARQSFLRRKLTIFGGKLWKAMVSDASDADVWLVFVTSVAAVFAFSAWQIFDENITRPLGAFGSIFLACAILTTLLSLLFCLTKGTKVPFVATIVLLPFLAETIYGSLGIHFDRHAVRRYEGRNGDQSLQRPTLGEAVAEWRHVNDVDGQVSPIIFVSASGGGIRAAYWAGSILGRLQDCIPKFRSRVFSLSGVSGGSLGVASFAALNELDRSVGDRNCGHALRLDQDAGVRAAQAFLRSFLAEDFLAPVVKQMLFGDTIRALIPWPLGEEKDRGVALEIAWERSWKRTCDHINGSENCKSGDRFTESFATFSKKKNTWTPVMLLNGVHQETGKRLITSNIKTDAETFVDTIDFTELVHHDVRLSTAVLNSARFPIVSPSGALMRFVAANERPRLMGHVIDGGYFDNNGTLTTQEIAAAVLHNLGALKSGTSCSVQNPRRAIFIEILNDTTLSDHDSIRRDARFETGIDVDRDLSGMDMNLPARQLLTAIQGLDATRSAHAVHASKSLARFADERACDERFFQFRICPGILPDPPLGWALSRASRDSMDALVLGLKPQVKTYQSTTTFDRFKACYSRNQEQFQDLIGLLR